MAKPIWDDSYYVKAYELAKAGLNDTKLSAALGVGPNTFRRWWEKNAYFRQAVLRGRGGTQRAKDMDTFADFVYGRLPPHLQTLWDQLDKCSDPDGNDVQRIEALLAGHGKGAKQHLFLYGLVRCDWNVSEVCRRLNIRRKTYEQWVLHDPDFAEMVDEVLVAKKDFCEGGLMALVREGNPMVTVFVNETLNRDRGYGRKVEVKGQIDHEHTHVGFTVDDLGLSTEAKRELLNAIRQKQTIVDAPKALTSNTRG